MIVRRLRSDEAGRLRDLRLRALADAPDTLGPFLEEETAFPSSYWQDVADDTACDGRRVAFVAEDGRWLAGMVGGDHDERRRTAHLVALWVDPVARDCGIGRRLVDAVVGWAVAREAERVELWVVDGHAVAQRLYAAAGFVATPEHQPVPYDPDRWERRLVRRLAPPA